MKVLKEFAHMTHISVRQFFSKAWDHVVSMAVGWTY